MRTRNRPLLLLLGLVACSDPSNYEPGPAYGELGVGIFLYECPLSGDPFCPGNSTVGSSFPKAFAVGGRINLQYSWADSDDHVGDPLPQLQSASPSILVREGDGFSALTTGYGAVLAVTGNSEVVDLVHLHIRDIAALRIILADLPGTTSLQEVTFGADSTQQLQAIAVDSDEIQALHWTPQKPTRRAVQQDPAAVERWRTRHWPRLKRGLCASTNCRSSLMKPGPTCCRRPAAPTPRAG